MDIMYIAEAAFLGAIVSSLLGWSESQESFIVKKFIASLIRAIIAGVSFAIAYNYAGEIMVIDILAAFIGGIGFDAGGNRIAGAIVAKIAKK